MKPGSPVKRLMYQLADWAIFSAGAMVNNRRPGAIISRLSPRDRELLKTLSSDDIADACVERPKR